jgi:hypothetical protein
MTGTVSLEPFYDPNIHQSKLIHGWVQAAPLLQLVHNDTLAPFPNVPP